MSENMIIDAESRNILEAYIKIDLEEVLQIFVASVAGANDFSDEDVDPEYLFAQECQHFGQLTRNDIGFRADVTEAADRLERAELFLKRVFSEEVRGFDLIAFSVLLAENANHIWQEEDAIASRSISIESLSEEISESARLKGETHRQIRSYLTELFDTAGYQEWRDSEASLKQRYRIPYDLSIKHRLAHHIFERAGVVGQDNLLEVFIDRHEGRIHLTDGFWVSSSTRVFPTSDESAALIRYAKANNYTDQFDQVVDPACGCGHHAMGFPEKRRISLDINTRALGFARLNALLSDDTSLQEFGLRSIYDGLPPTLKISDSSVLIIANMPFAVFPPISRRFRKLSQDGGIRGDSLTNALLKALGEYRLQRMSEKQARALILFYSLGRSADGPWRIEDTINDLLPDCDFSIELLKDEKLWRVNGKKVEDNPMPISSLSKKADCNATWSEGEKRHARDRYIALENDLKSEGWSHLGYGIADIRIS